MFFCYIALLGIAALPRLAAAGNNADVEIFIGEEGPFCGFVANSTVEFSVSARNMSSVRQVKFEFSWEPANAIAAVSGAIGETAKANSFIAPGPPQIKGQAAQWGIATLGGTGIEGEGHLVSMAFTLADSISPTTPIDIYLDLVSLGPSFNERDDIRPQVAFLRNYCDDAGQALSDGIFFRSVGQNPSFSAAGTGSVADSSAGEILVSARLLQAGHFRTGASFTWDITNPGAAPAYALINDEAIPIPAGATQQITTTSDERGQTYLLLDAEQATTLVFNTCAEGSCAESQVVWGDVATSISEPSGFARPREAILAQNYPNPFNAGTIIPFAIPEGGAQFAQIDIFNLMGQKVATPFAASTSPGQYVIHWDSQSATGAPAASGLYIYRLRTDSAELHRAMLLLR